MTETIKIYHGTTDLEGVVKRGAIMSPYRKNSEEVWNLLKREYDVLTKKFAAVARDYIASGNLIGGFGADQELLTNDEVLADIIQGYDIHIVDNSERSEYKELKRQGYIYFADEYAGARCHADPRREGDFGALLGVEIPRSLLRLSFVRYLCGAKCNLFEVPKEVPLQYLQEVFVSKEDFARAVQLLSEHELNAAMVSEFRAS